MAAQHVTNGVAFIEYISPGQQVVEPVSDRQFVFGGRDRQDLLRVSGEQLRIGDEGGSPFVAVLEGLGPSDGNEQVQRSLYRLALNDCYINQLLQRLLGQSLRKVSAVASPDTDLLLGGAEFTRIACRAAGKLGVDQPDKGRINHGFALVGDELRDIPQVLQQG